MRAVGGLLREAPLCATALLLAWVAAPVWAQEPPPANLATLENVARLIETADPNNIGGLFRAVRAASPDRGAIITMRELNKAMKEGPLNKYGAKRTAAINEKMSDAQRRIKDIIVATRREAHRAFALHQDHQEAARTLSGDGDVGSWRTSTDINSDVDWTAFGSDPAVTYKFVHDFYNPMLLKALGGEQSGLELKDDFDIVVTPQGSEREAGVFETRGGKKLAMTVMTVVTPVNADGSLGVEMKSDIGAELENMGAMARLRQMATQHGIYEAVFDKRGGFKISSGAATPPADPAAREAWTSFMEAADDEGLLEFDFKLVKRETLAGTCIDMAKHLHHEAIKKLGTLDKNGQIKRIMKYPGRSEWAYGKSKVSARLIEDYVSMGDSRIRRLLKQSAEFHRLKESKSAGAKKDLAVFIETLSNEYPDSEELGHLALEMIIRQSHLAMQMQVDQIAKLTDPTERGKQLQELIDDFAVAADGGVLDGFARAQVEALTAFKRASDDPAAYEAMRKTRRDLTAITDEANRPHFDRLRAYLRETEFGRKIIETHEEALVLAQRMKRKVDGVAYQIGQVRAVVSAAYDEIGEGAELLQLAETSRDAWKEYAETIGAPAKTFMTVANMLGTFVDGIEAVRTARTDADLAYNLGKLLWDNSAIGGLANSLYAFKFGGDNEAMAKFVMFALCPEAAIPELVGKIGGFVLRGGAQRLFDTQLDALYRASSFVGDPKFAETPQWKGKDPWLLADFVGYGAGAPAVAAFLDDLLLPGGYKTAEPMIARYETAGENERGNDAIARAAVVKAVWTTLQLGDQIVLKDDGALSEATQRIRFLTDEIVGLAGHMGATVARTPENFNMPEGASAGEQAALNKLVKERAIWVDKAKIAMAEAIARTFEERRRSDNDLSDAAMQKRLAELKALLTRLEILEPGLGHLSDEGSYNFILRNAPLMVSSKAQLRKMVEAINRYHDAYAQISSMRDAVAGMAQVQTGAPLDSPPFTGAPPLCGERGIDAQNTQAFFEKVRGANTETSEHLAGLKGAPLTGPFDERVRRGINAAVIAMAQSDMTASIARACRDLSLRIYVFDRQQFTDRSAESMQHYEEARLRRDALIEEFIGFYAGIKALQAQIVVAPVAPAQGQAVEGALRVAGGVVPPESVWKWTLEDDGRIVVSGEGPSFRFAAPFRGAYVLKAALVLFGAPVRTVSAPLIVAPPSQLTVVVTPPAPAPGGSVLAEARLSSGSGNAETEYDWRCDGCAIVTRQGSRATLVAPERGDATVRVVARSATTRSLLGEGAAAFRVNAPKPPQTQTPSTDPQAPSVQSPVVQPPPLPVGPPPSPNIVSTQTLPAPPPPKTTEPTSKTPIAETPPKSVVGWTLPQATDLSTWRKALEARRDVVDYLPHASRPEDKRLAQEAQARIESRMKEFWAAAARDGAVAAAFVDRWKAEVDSVHTRLLASEPPKCLASDAGAIGGDGGSKLTTLDGDAPLTSSQCAEAIRKQRAELLKNIERAAEQVRAAQRSFEHFSPEWPPYYSAMIAAENLMIDGDRTDWRTKGKPLSFDNPCFPSAERITAHVAPVGPAAPVVATPISPAVVAPPSVRLRIDPASKGHAEIAVSAQVANGRMPMRYDWIGAKSGTGDRAIYAAPLGKSVSAAVARVRVTDADGRTATAEIPLEAAPVTIQLTRTKPTAGVRVGDTVEFEAQVSVDGKAVSASDLVIRWEASSGVRFAANERPLLAANKATFTQLGQALVWVVALKREGGTLVTAAESNQVAVEIVAPTLELTVSPDRPVVGTIVRVTAHATPALPEADAALRWDITGEAENAGPTADPRVYTFIPKTEKPIKVTARLVERGRGGELARAEATVAARLHEVKIVNLGPAFGGTTTAVTIWRDGRLVTLESPITTHLDVGLRADLDPAPAEPPRYAWTVDRESTVSGNPGARETRVQRATVGAIDAAVEVRDARNIVLGRATTSVTVSVSEEQVNAGKAKVAELAAARADAERAWTSGDLSTACERAKAAAAIDAKLPIARTYCDGRDRIVRLVGEIDVALTPPAAARGIELAVAKLAEGEAINAKASALVAARKRIEAARAPQVKSDAAADAERKRRLDLLTSGAKSCNAADWAGCQAAISAALAGAEKVFAPADAGTIDKARRLLATAETELKTAADVARKRDIDRKRRLARLAEGADAFAKQDWATSRDALRDGLNGGDAAFAATDASLVAKARALLAKAEAALKAQQARQPEAASATMAADMAMERKRRRDLLLAGAVAFGEGRWLASRDALRNGLEGGDRVFTADDASVVAKARTLLAKAEAALKTPPQPVEPAKPHPDTVKQSLANSDGPTTKPAIASTDGHWRLESVRHFPSFGAPCAIGVRCTQGLRFNNQGVEHQIYEATDDHFTFGRSAPSVQRGWSRIRGWWQALPARLEPGQTISMSIGVTIETPGWERYDTTVTFYRSAGVGGESERIGAVTASDASKGGRTVVGPHKVPEGLDPKASEKRLEYRVGIVDVGSVAFIYHWSPAGAPTAEAKEPIRPANAQEPPRQPAATAPFDGVWVGKIHGLMQEPISVTFTVTGQRVTMVRSRLDNGVNGHVGTVAPDGTFVIEFPNNRYEGRMVGAALSGAWRMDKGILGNPRNGSLEARRR